jgi:hypothetical protein
MELLGGSHDIGILRLRPNGDLEKLFPILRGFALHMDGDPR